MTIAATAVLLLTTMYVLALLSESLWDRDAAMCGVCLPVLVVLAGFLWGVM